MWIADGSDVKPICDVRKPAHDVQPVSVTADSGLRTNCVTGGRDSNDGWRSNDRPQPNDVGEPNDRANAGTDP